MSKASETTEQPMETMDQAHFEKFANGPLLIKCFEVVKDAIEFVDEGGVIQAQDDTHLSFYEAYWALKVLFNRETGEDAKLISEKRIENLRASLYSGVAPEPISLPSIKVERLIRFDEFYFHQFDDLVLLAMAFNSTDEAYDELTHTRDQYLDDDAAWNISTSISNANTALRVLVARMTDGSIVSMCDIVTLISNPNGETLQ
ncbi:hypothetical protein [Pseudomonas fluorescens]|uniref:Uncharacterized protein n=1 Tax=Pseudomonas fluorescens TaxID=294 RepID=A0A5E7ED62_PSEFL|nr:hypothetical protein [Pseudomonas fluorescens]VVO24327.1 hypothetical protein PS710_04499 [Pseudomonas fluorescens]